MDIAGVQKALIGMALFDMWEAAFDKTCRHNKPKGDPLVAAAAQAFESYIQTAEMGMAAQISGVAQYALNPSGTSVMPITKDELAPFLAMNVVA